MSGFRPARNRQHPGDPPPEWAPLGRWGRIVILLTVIAGVVIALILSGTRSADALDDAPGAATPGPPPWLTGRVEFPGLGVASTISDEWLAFDLTGDRHELLASLDEVAAGLVQGSATEAIGT